jgi:hypothetical protein
VPAQRNVKTFPAPVADVTVRTALCAPAATGHRNSATPDVVPPIQVSVGEDGTVYAVDQRSLIFHWLGGAWQTISGGLSQISVGLSDRFFYSSTAVTPQGSWSTITNANAAAGGCLESSNTGDSLSFTFTGDGLALYRLMDSNGGQATVTVDGNAMEAIDFFFPQQQTDTNTQRWQIPAVLDHLGACQHKLTLTGERKPRHGVEHESVCVQFEWEQRLYRLLRCPSPVCCKRGSASRPDPRQLLSQPGGLAARGSRYGVGLVRAGARQITTRLTRPTGT